MNVIRMKKDAMKTQCSIEGCNETGRFALYELRPNLTKVWRTDLCDECETRIYYNNASLRKGHKIEEFKEVNIDN